MLALLLVKGRARGFVMGVVPAVAGLAILSSFMLTALHFPSFLDELRRVPEQVMSVSPDEKSTAIRIKLTEDGLAFLQQSHYLGIGAGNFLYGMEESQFFPDTGAASPHDLWLEILVDYGVVMFLLYLVFYIGLIWNLFKAFSKSGSRALQLASLAALVALVELSIACLSSSSIFRASFLWILFATSLCLVDCYRAELKERTSPAPEPAPGQVAGF
jgi:teichuronic acid biosynthesis protein TuaE